MEYYLPTYEDTDGDLMLVGDVSWNRDTKETVQLRETEGRWKPSADIIGIW